MNFIKMVSFQTSDFTASADSNTNINYVLLSAKIIFLTPKNLLKQKTSFCSFLADTMLCQIDKFSKLMSCNETKYPSCYVSRLQLELRCLVPCKNERKNFIKTN